MGLFKMSSGYEIAYTSSSEASVNPNPNPRPTNFRIEESFDQGSACVLHVVYPDCTTYEGSKILVFRDPLATVLQRVEELGYLDPHFLEEDETLVARFRPTEEGQALAIAFCELLQN